MIITITCNMKLQNLDEARLNHEAADKVSKTGPGTNSCLQNLGRGFRKDTINNKPKTLNPTVEGLRLL